MLANIRPVTLEWVFVQTEALNYLIVLSLRLCSDTILGDFLFRTRLQTGKASLYGFRDGVVK